MLHQLQYSSALLLCQFLYPYLQHQPPAHSDPQEAPTPAVTPRSLLAGTPEDRVLRWGPRESSPFAHLLGTRAKGSGGAREGEREEGTGKGAGPGGRRVAEARQGLSVSRGLIGGWPDESENNPLQELRFKILTIPIVDKDMKKLKFFGHCW